MSFCVFGGHVVEGNSLIATDPVDHDVERLPIHGCNRLRCPSCKALVRSVAKLGFRDENAKVDLNQLYDLPDLATSPLLAPRGNARLYLCRCTSWAEAIGRRALGGPDPDPYYDPHAPWRCDGHPVAELPHDFDGIEITPDNLADTVIRSLRGWWPAKVFPDDRLGGTWAARLYTRLAETRWQDGVVAAALASLSDPDPKARSRALHFFRILQLPAGAERAVAILDGDRDGFAGVPDPFVAVASDKTLEDSLWRVAKPLVAQPGLARELARAEALAPGRGRGALYTALAAGDPEWLAEHVEEIARANPEQVKALTLSIRSIMKRDKAKPLLEKLDALAGK
jgi:hypothetical protein